MDNWTWHFGLSPCPTLPTHLRKRGRHLLGQPAVLRVQLVVLRLQSLKLRPHRRDLHGRLSGRWKQPERRPF